MNEGQRLEGLRVVEAQNAVGVLATAASADAGVSGPSPRTSAASGVSCSLR